MTKTSSGARPDRGARRREELIEAGLQLLGERGWTGLTSRAVADRAGTHAGLLHYHFGGLPALRREVASSAVRLSFEPALARLTAAPDWATGIAAVVGAQAEQPDPASARISAELITASLQDDEVGELMRRTLGDARARLVPWLRDTGATHPEGLATLLVAALDGLLLHRLVDPALPLAQVARAAAALVAEPAPSADVTGRR